MSDTPHVTSMEQEMADAMSEAAIEYITHVLGFASDHDAADDLGRGDAIGENLQSSIVDAMMRSRSFARIVHKQIGEAKHQQEVHDSYRRTLGLIRGALAEHNLDSEIDSIAIGEFGVKVPSPRSDDEFLLIDAGDQPWGFAVLDAEDNMRAAASFLADDGHNNMAYEASKVFADRIEYCAVVAAMVWHVAADVERFLEFVEGDDRFSISVVLGGA